MSERRLKRSALRDVAGMLRSFSYAVHTAVQEQEASGLKDNGVDASGWGRFWQAWVSAIFLDAYLAKAREGRFLNADNEEIALLLDIYVLEKAVYEIGYEINNRPAWVTVPLKGILDLVQVQATS
jgi:maltose alpha-D-glucosyltransferase/alpha-amylase